MTLDSLTVTTIAGMAVATYFTKAGGLWLLGQTEISARTEAALEVIPGAVLVSLVAPTVVSGGVPEWGAALATLVVAVQTDNILFSMCTGVGTIWVLRQIPAF